MAKQRKKDTRSRPEPAYAYVGSFTTEKRRAKGDGLNAYRMNRKTGRWTHIQHIGGLVNPSWLTMNRARTVLYVGHSDETDIDAYAVERATGLLKHLSRADAGGRNVLRMMLDPSERFLVSANSQSRNVTVLPVAADGTLGAVCQTVEIPPGPGPRYRAFKQDRPLPHDIHFDPSGRFVLVPDRGKDSTFIFRFDPGKGPLEWAAPPAMLARPGAGPRHVAFHPALAIAWVLNEQDSTVTTCRWDSRRGQLTPLDVSFALPGDYAGDSIAAEIVYSQAAGTLYVSNRGHDSIAIYRVDRKTGFLRTLGWERRRIAYPRFIGIEPSENFLYCANERGHTVTPFRIDRRTGTLSLAGPDIAVGSPACIAFA